jgi:uncharacterized Ntn-hydrolase superfamily protein
MHKRRPSLVSSILVAFSSTGTFTHADQPERGTWSIVAVDFETGQIGIAGASCTHNVQGIGEVIPGVGVVVVQGMSSDDARDLGMKLLAEGRSPEDIVKAMRNPKFDPEDQQYAVVSMTRDHLPATYTGHQTDTWKGAATAKGVSVQGNSLVSEDVVANTLKTFHQSKGDLAERLVRALAAGAEAGGDKRCGDQRARSAFVTVFLKDDPASTPWFHLVVYGTKKGGEPAVEHLVNEFDALFPRSKNRKSTRMYVVPVAIK